jgi:prepilin-type N-terminal cleavage/methylation domain-containing protein
VRPASTRGTRGFTLIELMLVVAIIGVLAAIAIPGFQNYQNRSRRAESFSNLAAIAKMEKAYFSEYNVYTPTGGSFPGGGLGPHKRPWNAAAELAFSTIGWRPEGDVYHDYAVSTGGACLANDCFTASAYGDADGNGLTSVVDYVQPNSLNVTEPDLVLNLGVPVEPVTGRVQINEVAVNYAADPY